MNALRQLIQRIFSGDKRTALVQKNIIWSFIIKGWSGVVMLASIPVTIACLGEYKNGLWMTIATILLWIDCFDIGLGNGMRNKLTAYLANNKGTKARGCVSTTFFMLIFIIAPATLLIQLVIPLIDWYAILNVSPQQVPNLVEVLAISVTLVCTTFIFKFVGNVYMALQLPAVNNALVVGGQTLALLATLAVLMSGSHSLLWVAIANTLSPLFIYGIAYPITFEKRYPHLAPSFKLFNKESLHDIFGLGINFFILQIASVVLMTMSNVIISHTTSPQMVTPFQVAYRYFSLLTMIFAVIATPYWSATTDAYTKGDFEWIKHSMSSIRRIVLILSLTALLMVCVAPLVYQIWVGYEISIPFQLNAFMAIYFILIIVSTSYSYFLFGFGTLRLQLIFTSGVIVSFPVIAYLLCQQIGITGVLIALIVTQIPGAVCNIMQYHRIVNKRAVGIWIK